MDLKPGSLYRGQQQIKATGPFWITPSMKIEYSPRILPCHVISNRQFAYLLGFIEHVLEHRACFQ
jgi:hypothetical protein